MRFHSLLPLGLLFSPFGSCGPGAGQPETTGLKTAITTDVSHSEYLRSHGYSIWQNQDGIYWILSDYSPWVRAVVEISIDMEHKSVTILENHLPRGFRQRVSDEKLKLPQIFQGFCYAKNIPCHEMQSITMDIADQPTHMSVKKHRQDNTLGVVQEFEIAANQPGWDVFSKTTYYNDAAGMLPGIEAQKITIKRHKRASPNPRYAAVVPEVMIVSFKQPGLKDE